jgi:hypothetical protein
MGNSSSSAHDISTAVQQAFADDPTLKKICFVEHGLIDDAMLSKLCQVWLNCEPPQPFSIPPSPPLPFHFRFLSLQALIDNTNVNALELDGNPMLTDAGASAVQALLASNSFILSVTLSETDISPFMIEKIEKMCAENSTKSFLRHLELACRAEDCDPTVATTFSDNTMENACFQRMLQRFSVMRTTLLNEMDTGNRSLQVRRTPVQISLAANQNPGLTDASATALLYSINNDMLVQDWHRRPNAVPISLNLLDVDKTSFSLVRKQQLRALVSENCLNTCLFLVSEHMKEIEEPNSQDEVVLNFSGLQLADADIFRLTDQLTREFEEGETIFQSTSVTCVSINISENPKVTDRGIEYMANNLLSAHGMLAPPDSVGSNIAVTSIIARNMEGVTDKSPLSIERVAIVPGSTCPLGADAKENASSKATRTLDFVDFTGSPKVHKYLRRLNRWGKGKGGRNKWAAQIHKMTGIPLQYCLRYARAMREQFAVATLAELRRLPQGQEMLASFPGVLQFQCRVLPEHCNILLGLTDEKVPLNTLSQSKIAKVAAPNATLMPAHKLAMYGLGNQSLGNEGQDDNVFQKASSGDNTNWTNAMVDLGIIDFLKDEIGLGSYFAMRVYTEMSRGSGPDSKPRVLTLDDARNILIFTPLCNLRSKFGLQSEQIRDVGKWRLNSSLQRAEAVRMSDRRGLLKNVMMEYFETMAQGGTGGVPDTPLLWAHNFSEHLMNLDLKWIKENDHILRVYNDVQDVGEGGSIAATQEKAPVTEVSSSDSSESIPVSGPDDDNLPPLAHTRTPVVLDPSLKIFDVILNDGGELGLRVAPLQNGLIGVLRLNVMEKDAGNILEDESRKNDVDLWRTEVVVPGEERCVRAKSDIRKGDIICSINNISTPEKNFGQWLEVMRTVRPLRVTLIACCGGQAEGEGSGDVTSILPAGSVPILPYSSLTSFAPYIYRCMGSDMVSEASRYFQLKTARLKVCTSCCSASTVMIISFE